MKPSWESVIEKIKKNIYSTYESFLKGDLDYVRDIEVRNLGYKKVRLYEVFEGTGGTGAIESIGYRMRDPVMIK